MTGWKEGGIYTSVSTVSIYPHNPILRLVKYNSVDGSCGSPVVDYDSHLVGIHVGTNKVENLFQIVNWPKIEEVLSDFQ